MSDQAIGRRKDVRPKAVQPLSVTVADELAHGTTTEDLIERLVARGWTAQNATHYLHYIEAARSFAGFVSADEEGPSGVPPAGDYGPARPSDDDRVNVRWGAVVGIAALAVGAVGLTFTYAASAPIAIYSLWVVPLGYGFYRLLRREGPGGEGS